MENKLTGQSSVLGVLRETGEGLKAGAEIGCLLPSMIIATSVLFAMMSKERREEFSEIMNGRHLE